METGYQLLLSGPPGVGKTTTGAQLASRLQRPFFDLDELVQSKVGLSPAEMLRSRGEEEFRQLELEVLKQVPDEPAVVALGGGTLTRGAAREVARERGLILGLRAGLDTLAARVEADPTPRPLLDGREGQRERLSALLEARAASYRGVDFMIDAEATPEQIVEAAEVRLDGMRFRTSRIGATTTRILIGHNLAEALSGAVAQLAPRRTVVMIADAGVPETIRQRYANTLSGSTAVFSRLVPGGESCKTWRMLEEVLEAALEAGAGRQSVVIGLGGGAVLDLAGLAASLLGRGAPLILVPTTVLAQVDASVGGKCAINTGAGRNLLGAFHPAAEVIVDLDFLDSLPEDEHRSGMVEVLKMGLIADADLFRRASAAQRAELETIDRALELKAQIVARDPFDRGERQLLNLGHTLGHALEDASNYTIRHGEAVALGLHWIIEISMKRVGLDPSQATEIKEKIAPFLPRALPRPETWSKALERLRQDKKGDVDGVELIVLPKIGEASRLRVSWSEVEGSWMPFGGSSQ